MNGLTRICLDEESKGIFEPTSIRIELEANPVIVEADETIKESEYNDFKKFIKKERKEKMERCKINHYRGCGNHFARECLTDRGLEETVKEFRNNIDYFIEGMQEHLDTVKSYNDCPF